MCVCVCVCVCACVCVCVCGGERGWEELCVREGDGMHPMQDLQVKLCSKQPVFASLLLPQIWITAQRQNRTSASYFWVGSDVPVLGQSHICPLCLKVKARLGLHQVGVSFIVSSLKATPAISLYPACVSVLGSLVLHFSALFLVLHFTAWVLSFMFQYSGP